MPADGISTTTRLRALIDEWFAVVVLLALFVAVLGGILVYQGYFTTEVRTETRQVANWESVGSFDHRARVVNGTGPFETGTVLENRSVYFQSITPVLNGSLAYTYTASDDGSVDVRTTLVVVARSVEESGTDGNATELWRTEEVLATEEVTSVSPGETVQVPFSWNVTASRQRVEEIEEQLGGTPGETELFLTARVELSGTRNGQSVDRTRTYRLSVSFRQGVYRVDDPGRVRDGDTRRERVTVETTPGPLERAGGPALVVLGVVGLVGIAVGRYAGALTVDERERAYLDYLATREEYDDWITAARAVEVDGDRERIPVDSLQGLVDLAIDTDARVIEDVERDHLFVIHDDVRYVYDPPSGLEVVASETSPDDSPVPDEDSSSDPSVSSDAPDDAGEGESPDSDADGD